MRESKKKTRAKSKEQNLKKLLFPRVLLPGEDSRLYAEFRRRVFEAVCPRDVVEEVLVADIIDNQWDILRYRRLRDQHLDNERVRASEHLIESIYPLEFDVQQGARLARKKAIDRMTGDADARKEVADRMKQFGLDEGSITAAAFAGNIDFVEKVERMIAAAETRKNKALREIELRRSFHSGQIQRALSAMGSKQEADPQDDSGETLAEVEENA